MARAAVGADAAETVPGQATVMAIWMVAARMFGERGVADRLEAGLALFGTRARIARLFATEEEMAHIRARDGDQFRQDRAPGYDVRRILAEVPRAEERVAYETLAEFGVRGSERRERVRRFEAERELGWTRWEDRDAQLQQEHEIRVHQYDDFALVMACLIAERIEADNQVHDLDLRMALRPLLMDSASALHRLRKRAQPIAMSVAEEGAKADHRAELATSINSKNRFAQEMARYRGDPGFTRRDQREAWRDLSKHSCGLQSRDLAEPTKLERLAATAVVMTGTDERKRLADAMVKALSFGLPERDADELRRERAGLISELGAKPSREDRLNPGLWNARVRRLYESFTELEIRALASGEGGLAEELAQGADRGNIAKNIKYLLVSGTYSVAPWYDRYRAQDLSLEASRGQWRGMSMGMEPF